MIESVAEKVIDLAHRGNFQKLPENEAGNIKI
jgi:hypothetical protein